MRYFQFALKASSEQIQADAKIKLRDYDYGCPIAAMNTYMYKNMKNGICYFAYREEGAAIWAAFTYDERKGACDDAYDYILGMLNDALCIKKAKSEPCEITMHQYYENLLEGKRRSYVYGYMNIMESSSVRIFDYYGNEKERLHYELQEKIIAGHGRKENPMYDESMRRELSNIEAHQNTSDFKGNMVHYVISSKSAGAASDMAGTLMQALSSANRLSGRRMQIIREIEPDVYKGNNHLEELIENNYGGVMLMDLSEKFGCDPVDYGMACKYMEKLVKQYRNDCLFVFTYNMEKPGFAYQLLPLVQKHVMPVMVKEGKGSRRAAISYMKELIRASEHSKYAGQANEFMKLFPGKEFMQTDVLVAFEQFEPWCLNRNVLRAYDYSLPDAFLLDRDADGNSYEKLQKMVGLASVKEQIDRILAADLVEKERKKRMGNGYEASAMHMIFGGNPGTAKTTVAKLFAGIAKEKGVLKSGAFVERGGMDLDGIGCVTEIREAFMAAKGGVLFIDEAYSLKSDVSITALLQEMENRRDEVIVILAGYNQRMREFMERNEGLKSRIPHWIDFPDYNVDELAEIFQMMLKERGFSATQDAEREARDIFEKARLMDNFGNGRYVRNLIQRAAQNQSVRLLAHRESAERIRKKELFLRSIYEAARGDASFGNGRFVRKMLEEAEMNLAERIAGLEESEITSELITIIQEGDIPELEAGKEQKKGRIGFCVA